MRSTYIKITEHNCLHLCTSILNALGHNLMSIPCIIKRIRKNQQYALSCTTHLFYVLSPTWQATAETRRSQYIE
jgi:hypothetical protein